MTQYVVIAYIQAKYVTALVEAKTEVEARWKGLVVLTQHGYSTRNVSTPAVHQIDVNDIIFNPSERGKTNGS